MFHDKRGMTLLELMIALLLMAIVAMALMQSSLVVITNSVKNELRDEAVSVAEQRMNESRTTPFSNLANLPATTTITRNIRAIANFPFMASLVTTPVNSNSTHVAVTVTWTYKGSSYNHGVSTVLRNR
jgi:type IV pilus assembly protein PilV